MEACKRTEDTKDLILKTDKRRSGYYNYYTNKNKFILSLSLLPKSLIFWFLVLAKIFIAKDIISSKNTNKGFSHE